MHNGTQIQNDSMHDTELYSKKVSNLNLTGRLEMDYFVVGF
ncbi:hypothetical protein [Thiomicrorhabdus indica]|nr:hypothetical protein [Thiomicrorhabdus indica]